MFNLTRSHTGEPLHSVVIVAFDRTSGRVHGTCIHSSYGPDAPGVTRSRERLLRDVRGHLAATVELDALELRDHEVPDGPIECVDPATGRLAKNPQARIPRVVRI